METKIFFALGHPWVKWQDDWGATSLDWDGSQSLLGSYLSTVLDEDAATVALVAKFSLAIDRAIVEAIWTYQCVHIFATLDGAIGPNISVYANLLGMLSTLICVYWQAKVFSEAREAFTSPDGAAVVVWRASHSGGCSKQGCKSESSFHCWVFFYWL